MPTSPETPHPIEAVYVARDALEHAASAQRHLSDTTRTDLVAYGSALTSALNAIGDLVTVLSDQLAGFDTDEIQRQAARDNPARKLWYAIHYLDNLRGVLTTAVSDANRYWALVESVDADTRPEP